MNKVDRWKLLSTREIQMVELELIKSFDLFCKKYNLRWNVNGGTLLGTIRHHGFIPWDDDVDIDMPRPDYEKMLELVQSDKELPEFIYVKGKMPFCKWYDTRTRIEREWYQEPKDEQHIWIDIFPLDGLPEKESERIRLYKKQKRRMLAYMAIKAKKSKSFLISIVKSCLKKYYGKNGLKRLAALLDLEARKIPFKDAKLIGVVCWGAGWNKEVRDARTWYQSIQQPFEDYLVNTPAMDICDRYLKQMYGDYMALPPEEKRITHRMKVYMRESE